MGSLRLETIARKASTLYITHKQVEAPSNVSLANPDIYGMGNDGLTTVKVAIYHVMRTKLSINLITTTSSILKTNLQRLH
jgi:hypothetical protein